MTLSDIAHLRLVSQQLSGASISTPGRLVEWMGAMQAQDMAMSFWAVGVRTRTATRRSVVAALDRGTILRTHVMRPTWHLVPGRDLGWMLDLTASHVKKGIGARQRRLGLTADIVRKSHAIIERTIRTRGSASRRQLVDALVSAGYSTGDNRMAHLLLLAELDQLICSGPVVDDEPTYALLGERVRRPVRLDRDEALSTLAIRYLSSHGPATLRDFAWWSGLPMAEVRRSFDMARPQMAVSRVEGNEYWHRPDLRDLGRRTNDVWLLPAYDEFTIAYADRSASIVDRHRARAFSSNGIFRPLVVVGGEVIGIWRRERTKEGVVVAVSAFSRMSGRVGDSLQQAAKRYGAFLAEPVGVRLMGQRTWSR